MLDEVVNLFTVFFEADELQWDPRGRFPDEHQDSGDLMRMNLAVSTVAGMRAVMTARMYQQM